MIETAEERLNDLCKNVYVAAITARGGKLNTKAAEGISARLRSAASDMIEPADSELLREAAGRLESLSLRVKAQTGRGTRVKAASAPRSQPDIAAMNRAADAEQMASAGPFDRTEFEATERARIEEQNKQLAQRDRQLEAERRRQIGEPEPKPWWRR